MEDLLMTSHLMFTKRFRKPLRLTELWPSVRGSPGVQVDQRHKETYWHSRFLQAFKIWEDTREINLNPVVEDSWIWTWETSGSFFSKSVDILSSSFICLVLHDI
jgi:hypothetical protein